MVRRRREPFNIKKEVTSYIRERVAQHTHTHYLLDDEELVRLELPRLLSPELLRVDNPPLQLA